MSKESFISKASKILRNGKVISSIEKINFYKKLSNEEIVDSFIESEEFSETILDFNTYFLKSKAGTIFDSNFNFYKLNGNTILQNSAILSAIEVANNGDYLKLLAWKQPLYVNKMGSAIFRQGDGDIHGDAAREQIFLKLIKANQEILTWVNTQKIVNKKLFCQKLVQRVGADEFSFAFSGGSEFNLAFYLNLDLSGKMNNYCFSSSKRYDVKTEFPKYFESLKELKRDFSHLTPQNYSPQKLSEYKSFEFASRPLKQHFVSFSFNFWQTYQNSSTNFNRKRAAYILSTYFCDDLTPIGFVSPKEHGKDQHGSKASCMSCHYKLDPMAGFFKNNGLLGTDFSNSKQIILDDGSVLNRKKYQKIWKDKMNQWNIGYIRSNTNTYLNSYGETLEDLYKIIAKAPEVKACLVKRMSEYFIGDEITIDSIFLKDLTENFIEEVKGNSTIALKNTIKKLILSKSFLQLDPQIGVCYDSKNTSSTKSSPPCEINEILQNNCVSCHNNSKSRPYLNLNSWVKDPFGKANFAHFNKRKKQYSRNQTFKMIQQRISSSNNTKAMPPEGRHMTTKSREKLFLWIEKHIGEFLR